PAFAALVQALNDSPIAKGPQAHTGVAAADVQPLHHVIRTERNSADVEQGVNLGHGAVDAPGLPHLTPAADEQILGRAQRLVAGVSRDRFVSRISSVRYIESHYIAFQRLLKDCNG